MLNTEVYSELHLAHSADSFYCGYYTWTMGNTIQSATNKHNVNGNKRVKSFKVAGWEWWTMNFTQNLTIQLLVKSLSFLPLWQLSLNTDLSCSLPHYSADTFNIHCQNWRFNLLNVNRNFYWYYPWLELELLVQKTARPNSRDFWLTLKSCRHLVTYWLSSCSCISST